MYQCPAGNRHCINCIIVQLIQCIIVSIFKRKIALITAGFQKPWGSVFFIWKGQNEWKRGQSGKIFHLLYLFCFKSCFKFTWPQSTVSNTFYIRCLYAVSSVFSKLLFYSIFLKCWLSTKLTSWLTNVLLSKVWKAFAWN